MAKIKLELESEYVEILLAVLSAAFVGTARELPKLTGDDKVEAANGVAAVMVIGNTISEQARAQHGGASDEASQVKSFIMQGTDTVN